MTGVGNGLVQKCRWVWAVLAEEQEQPGPSFFFLLATGDEPEQVLHRCNNRSLRETQPLGNWDCKDNLIDLLLRRVRQSDEVA